MLAFFNLPPLLQAALAGLLSALWSVIIPQIPVVGLLLSPFLLVPLFFVSFSRGLKNGIQAGLISTFFVFLLTSPLASCVFFTIHFIPFMAISALFLQGKGAGTILSKITGGFLMALIGGLIILNSQNMNWQQSILHHLDQITDSPSSLKPLVEQAVGWLPSLLGISMIASLTANAAVAYGLLKKFYHNNVRVLQEKDWDTPLHWDIVAVFGMMIGSFSKFFDLPQTLLIAKTIVILSCVPLGFVGLRICYLRLSLLALGRLWFRLLCLLSFLLVWPFIFIVLLGFIEPWYGLTKRFSKNQRNTHDNDI